MVYDTRIDSVSYTSDNIVLIIGESHNRHHNSYYGYPLNTNRYTEAYAPYVFTDVISPVNSTIYAIRSMISMYESGSDGNINDAQLLLPIFKEAGYEVRFDSNQNVKEKQAEGMDMALNILYDNPIVEKASFDKRNTEKYRYDGELVDCFMSETSADTLARHTLSIIHLMGQHVAAKDRFPASDKVFSADSLSFRTDLSDADKQTVADYDNATLYCDKQIARIVEYFRQRDAIIIYVADHGDEANDFRLHVGRTYSLEAQSPACIHCQVDIPCLMFATDLYRERHPEMMERIAASTDLPMMTDALPHLLLYLGGVHTRWFNPSHCILSSDYDANRKRILMKGGVDYDSVCQPGDKVIGME